MIVNAFLSVLYTFCNLLVYLIPTWVGMPTPVADAIIFMNTAIGRADSFLPISDFIVSISAGFLVESSIKAFEVVDWTWKKVRG